MSGNLTTEVKVHMERMAETELGGTGWVYENGELTLGARRVVLEKIDETKPLTIRNIKLKEV